MNVLAGFAEVEGGEHLVDRPDHSPQFPARGREHQDAVHEGESLIDPPQLHTKRGSHIATSG